MAISINFSEYFANDGWWMKLLMSSGYLAIAISDMIYLYCITMTAEEAYGSLKSLVKPLEFTVIQTDNLKEREQLRILIKEIETVEPLNGNGYFTITKSTLTSIASTSITYLIILLQFRNI